MGFAGAAPNAKRPTLKIPPPPPKEGPALWLYLAEAHVNGVMSWWLISLLLSRDGVGGGEKIQVCDP